MDFNYCANLFSVLFILCCYLLHVSVGIDTITSSQFIKDPETLISKDGNFTFGFFSPKNSTNRYVGIWWKSQSTILWVANRNQPLNDSNGIVTISEEGNLVVLNGQKQVIWSSNVSNIATNTSSRFSGFGNLVLLENTTGNNLWQSIQLPSDTFLPGMKLSNNKITGKKLTSWKSPSDPSVGNFSSSTVERLSILEVFIWNGTRPCWRSGPWNGRVFTGVEKMEFLYTNSFQGGDDGEGNNVIFHTKPNDNELRIYHLNSQGIFEKMWWDDQKKEMKVRWTSQDAECDVYGLCGEFTSCNSLSSPVCSCLRGFEPKNTREWNRNNWTGGCVRKRPLQCKRVINKTTSRKEDGFLKLQMVKVPDFAEGLGVTPDTCKILCLENCSCVAYSHHDVIGCMSWTGKLLDIQQFQSGGLDLYVRVSDVELGILWMLFVKAFETYICH